MNNFLTFVAARTLALLDLRKARLDLSQTSFYVWDCPDRIVIIFDTTVIDTGKINEDFAHRLSTQLQGRMVVRSNHRGMFLQVGLEIPPALVELNPVPLDLSKQLTPYHMPIGSTFNGRDLWLSLLDGDSFLIGGTRGFGKTGIIHGFIQGLINGDAVEIYAFDGKGGTEFARYADQSPKFHIVTNLSKTLADLAVIAKERRKVLLASGKPNIMLYNEAHPEAPILPIALIVDEAALTTDEEKAGLVSIVERERATGFHPIIGTNRPAASALLMKSNLATRICLPVQSWHASQMVLGENGAESLPKLQGRGLIAYQARMTEFQSFRVIYPEPSEDTVRMVIEQEEQQAETVPTVIDETARILELDAQGKSMTAIMKAIWGSNGGGRYDERADLIRSVLAKKGSSSSTSTAEMPQNGLLEAV